MEDAFRFADDLGPFKIIQIYRPSVGLKAVVAIDNIACGPAIGGVRMAPDVSTEEAFRLARAMTFKNAAAGLPARGRQIGDLCRPQNAAARQGAADSGLRDGDRQSHRVHPGSGYGNGRAPTLRRLERIVRPRAGWLAGTWTKVPVGIICLVLAIIITLPVPLGHVVPGTAISVLALGLIERDGVAIALGILTAAFGLAVVIIASAGILNAARLRQG
jgi:hypothetical protein